MKREALDLKQREMSKRQHSNRGVFGPSKDDILSRTYCQEEGRKAAEGAPVVRRTDLRNIDGCGRRGNSCNCK
jgi:hypothetical protein